MSFDQESWERRWTAALAGGANAVSERSPNRHLVAETAGLEPGRVLDAGSGHGAEALWLADRGWRVEALDFSVTALDHGRAAAKAMGDEIAGRIEWVEADLSVWAPPGPQFDLVVCLYVHIEGPVPEFVARLAAGVAPGGTLLMAGHLPVDPRTGAPSRAADQNQVDVSGASAALSPGIWDIEIAEDRHRPGPDGGADAVIKARRRG